MNITTTTEARPHPLADVPKAVEALVKTGEALRKFSNVKVADDQGTESPISRNTWYSAVANTINSGQLDKKQVARLKRLRDELRRTKVKA
ncbi:hypothetical protein ISG21_00450 [Burkholderia pseudomallei]|nr:hypothetical protein [Burkholderia pseudomallei]MBF3843957.1 hypothetical protein [Burkholderia pseudomallei]